MPRTPSSLSMPRGSGNPIVSRPRPHPGRAGPASRTPTRSAPPPPPPAAFPTPRRSSVISATRTTPPPNPDPPPISPSAPDISIPRTSSRAAAESMYTRRFFTRTLRTSPARHNCPRLRLADASDRPLACPPRGLLYTHAFASGTRARFTMPATPIDPGVRVGHIHLKVADIERSLRFYRDVLGFEVTQRYGPDAAFLSAGGYHHHIGLNTWESKGGPPPARGTTGLFHVAFLYPTRAALADALRRLHAAHIPLTGAADHGVSEALYLNDPDSNGVELYWDRPQSAWPRSPDGGIAMYTRPLDLDALAREAR